MKSAAIWLLGLLASCAGIDVAFAQYGLSLTSEYSTYLRFESVNVHVTLRNDGDHMLLLGGLRQSVLLQFEVLKNGRDVPRTSKGLMVENMLIMPGQAKDIKVDLRPHFDFQSPGQYQLAAIIVVGDLKYTSAKSVIDVVPGLEIKGIDRPVPGNSSRIRTYSLRYWDRKNTERLFLCVSDKVEGMSYGVFDLGPLVRVNPPALTVDVSGNVLVRHQSGNGIFSYTTFRSSLNGVEFVRQEIKKVNDIRQSSRESRTQPEK